MSDGRASRSFWRSLGPGLVFAGAAIGVSHLVQSTRAGAGYGFALCVFVVAANVLKYPSFRFGPQYAAATGTSLLEGYRRQGPWALALYALLTVLTMCTIQAAVTFVTAGLLLAVTGLPASPLTASVGLTVVCAGLLARGDYAWLDAIVRVVVVILTLCTFAATALLLPQVAWAEMPIWPRAAWFSDRVHVAFIAGLVGWMPSAVDISVWHSLWSLARLRGGAPPPHSGDVAYAERSLEQTKASLTREAVLDFNVGYVGTALLALCFLTLGAGVMYGRADGSDALSASAVAFSASIIELYAATLGGWARPVIGVAAFAVMFSTTLTVVDGFPRALSTLVARVRGPEPFGGDAGAVTRRAYWAALAVLGGASLVVVWRFLGSLKAMVDLATTLSFVTAPALAWLNHRAMISDDVPQALRPQPWLRVWSLVSVLILSVFALYYLYFAYGPSAS